MDKNPGLSTTRPISVWQKPVKADFKELFKALGKGIIDGAFQNWNKVGLDLADATAALGIDTQPEEIAWLLIYRSLTEGIKTLILDSQTLMKERQPSDDELEESCQNLKAHLDAHELTIDLSFFDNPKQFSILEEIKPYLADWLEHFVETHSQAEAISNRLPSYFVFALHNEWCSSTKDYAQIWEKVDTPFTKAKQREQEWLRYCAFLQKQIEEPMFGEAFGLKQVYVPLCAYFVKELPQSENRSYERKEKSKEKYCVVDLATYLKVWLDRSDPNDAIRLISGGPGCGKSSFTKFLVANLAENNSLPVLFIPLHEFNSSGDLVESVGKYLQETRLLSFNPLEPETEEPRLLLVFDGLDELAMQGKWGAEAAQQFVQNISRLVGRLNSAKMRIQVLMSGRELIVQSISEFKREGQILHVLPYSILNNAHDKYYDPQGLVREDRRDIWWKKYGDASGSIYTKAPDVLKAENLTEITNQPLLNYLVALSYTRGKIDFSDTSNLNEIYADLLASIYERGWEKRKQHPALRDVSQNSFTRILEEIAVSAWHGNSGNGRMTTVKEIKKRCNSPQLQEQFARFTKGAEEGVTRLLTAFYFRQSDWRDDEYTFEFTHKSFGEYLSSKRIVREIERLHRLLHKDELDERWDERTALMHWTELCGTSKLDRYMFQFIRNEIALKDKEVVKAWQKTFCQLIEYILSHGMPMELAHPRPGYQEECRQARNAEEALLATVSACASYIKELYKISWPDEQSFMFWLGRLQDFNSRDVLVASCLNYLNSGECLIQGANLEGANLEGANLEGANLEGANLEGANLEGANLEGAKLKGAKLQRTDLEGADLQRVRLQRTDLEGAHLEGANLLEAHLEGANLLEAHLEGANLEGADLEGANLVGANLVGAKLLEAKLQGANLLEANLQGANLQGANLQRVNLQRANLVGADLEGADLEGANLLGANLGGVNLEGANLLEVIGLTLPNN